MFRAFVHHTLGLLRSVLANMRMWRLDSNWLAGSGTERHKPVSGRKSSPQVSVTDEGQAPAH